MKSFRTHEGTLYPADDPTLKAACKRVADDWRKLGYAIRKEDAYAAHVTPERKEQALNDMLDAADQIEAGNITSFTIWQRVNTVLTGECVALLKKA